MRFEEIAAEVRKGREFTKENTESAWRIFEGKLQFSRKYHDGSRRWQDSEIEADHLLCADNLSLVPIEVTKYQWLFKNRITGIIQTTSEFFENTNQAVEWLTPNDRQVNIAVGPCKESAKTFTIN